MSKSLRVSMATGFGIVFSLMAVGQAQDVDIRGVEFAGAINLPQRDLKADAMLFVPNKTARVQSAVVILNYGDLAYQLYTSRALRGVLEETRSAAIFLRLNRIKSPNDEPNTPIPQQLLRNAAVGGGEMLFKMLQLLAKESSRRELEQAPLLIWGWSAAASFATTFAALHPDRTIGFVRYHTHRRDVLTDLEKVKGIPALLIAGGKDQTAGVDDARMFKQDARQVGAPWAFVIEPESPHASMDVHRETLRTLTAPWIRGVLQQRVTGNGQLRSVSAGWLADDNGYVIAPHATFSGNRDSASWLPDESSARGWRGTSGRRD